MILNGCAASPGGRLPTLRAWLTTRVRGAVWRASGATESQPRGRQAGSGLSTRLLTLPQVDHDDPELGKKPPQQRQRNPEDIGVVTLNFLDEPASEAIDRK